MDYSLHLDFGVSEDGPEAGTHVSLERYPDGDDAVLDNTTGGQDTAVE